MLLHGPLQDILELKLKAAVEAVRSNVVLLEKSTVATLRSENEVFFYVSVNVVLKSFHHLHIPLSMHRA